MSKFKPGDIVLTTSSGTTFRGVVVSDEGLNKALLRKRNTTLMAETHTFIKNLEIKTKEGWAVMFKGSLGPGYHAALTSNLTLDVDYMNKKALDEETEDLFK